MQGLLVRAFFRPTTYPQTNTHPVWFDFFLFFLSFWSFFWMSFSRENGKNESVVAFFFSFTNWLILFFPDSIYFAVKQIDLMAI